MIIKMKFIPTDYIIQTYIDPQIDPQTLSQAVWIFLPIGALIALLVIGLLIYLVKKKPKFTQKLAKIKASL